MALNLKLKRKCHIVAPDWLTVGSYKHERAHHDVNSFTEFLQDRLTEETTSPHFSHLPFRFAEISKVLLDRFAV